MLVSPSVAPVRKMPRLDFSKSREMQKAKAMLVMLRTKSGEKQEAKSKDCNAEHKKRRETREEKHKGGGKKRGEGPKTEVSYNENA